MKANKKTLMAVKSFLENRDGWDLDEVMDEIVHRTKLLKHKDMGEKPLATDECCIKWGEDKICTLSDFIEEYTELFIEDFCKILDSFVGEDLSYLEEYK